MERSRRSRRPWSSLLESAGGKDSRLGSLEVLQVLVVLRHPSALECGIPGSGLGLCARCAGCQVRRQVPLRTVSKPAFHRLVLFWSIFIHLGSVRKSEEAEFLLKASAMLNGPLIPADSSFIGFSLKYTESYFLTLTDGKRVSQKALWHRVLPVSYEAVPVWQGMKEPSIWQNVKAEIPELPTRRSWDG